VLATITEITTDVRSLINEATASFWTDVEIARWANEGQEIFCTKTRCLSKWYTYTLKAADIVNNREVRLYSDFIAFGEGGVTVSDKQIQPTSLVALNEWAGNWRDNTGTPTHYYLRGDSIGFVPRPSVGDVIGYYGIERAATLTGSTVPLSSDYRTIAFRSIIRDYTVAMCWKKKNEMAKARDYMNEFDKGILEANAVFNGSKNQGKRFIPEYSRYVHAINTDPLEL